MTAITYGGETPTVGGDADTWGAELNTALTEIAADLQMLNATPANTILGRNEGTTGEVERLTPTELVAMLPTTEFTARANPFTGDSGAGGVKGAVPAPAAGDAALKKVLRADGTWGTETKAFGQITGASGVFVGRGATVARLGTGSYRVTFSTAAANDDYVVLLSLQNSARLTTRLEIGAKTTAEFDVVVENAAGATADPVELYFQVLA
jgi:hypothetical protein